MMNNHDEEAFMLIVKVNTNDTEAAQPVLLRLFGKECVSLVYNNEFHIEAQLEGEDAKELNRSLLSKLHKAERKTRLRAEWISEGTTDRFFDYVLKKSTRIKVK
jgi:hypothetical protein